MPKVLVVEDDQASREFLSKFLRREGHEVTEATNGEEALHFAAQTDIVLLDVMMPKLGGWEVIKILRQDHPSLPVIMLTALAARNDQVQGLELGADDYVSKPYDLVTLGLRIKAILRRIGMEKGLEFGELRIMPEAKAVLLDDKPLSLSKVEYELLLTLTRHPGHIFTRERLLERVWGSDYFGMERVVDVRMVALRKKLGDDTRQTPFIETVRGLGYRFKASTSKAGEAMLVK
jgi:two-component system, OmpR family, alkaline phosphatase synthesis response regulator PhoP